ncbi:substrate-binding domain-containing protein, partial [Blautia obeum]|uniref:substrate-binding domain-containing protein n=1 Tax=Blautia obeum TaxID=40520 RepID=UPI000A87753D
VTFLCNVLGQIHYTSESPVRYFFYEKVVKWCDSKNLEYNNPPITSIRFDTVRLGKMACAKLLNILGEKPLEDTVPLNYQVVLRESTQ